MSKIDLRKELKPFYTASKKAALLEIPRIEAGLNFTPRRKVAKKCMVFLASLRLGVRDPLIPSTETVRISRRW